MATPTCHIEKITVPPIDITLENFKVFSGDLDQDGNHRNRIFNRFSVDGNAELLLYLKKNIGDDHPEKTYFTLNSSGKLISVGALNGTEHKK